MPKKKLVNSLVSFIVACLIVTAVSPASARRDFVNAVRSLIPVAVPADRMSVWFSKAGDRPERVLTTLYDGVLRGGYIYVSIYSITHPKIVASLVNAKKRDVDVRVIVDSSQSRGKKQQIAIDTMKLVGIQIKTNTYSGLMHMKVSIVNGAFVTTGSYNYTTSASTRNAENLLVIPYQVAPVLYNRYLEQFETMWNDSGNYTLFES